MPLIRLDPHAHLYDCYSLSAWVEAALQNLRPAPDICAAVVVVDRAGQDSFARLRKEVPSLGEWEESHTTSKQSLNPVVGTITYHGEQLLVVRGVQYVTAERLEVLGLGVARSLNDGVPCEQVIDEIRLVGGVACIPWSPGKWLGNRGRVVARVLERYEVGDIVFGDISMRSIVGPPSRLLARARRKNFSVLAGSDPLPRQQDLHLVGSYGMEFVLPGGLLPAESLLTAFGLLRGGGAVGRVWGRPNGPIRAFLRFLATL